MPVKWNIDAQVQAMKVKVDRGVLAVARYVKDDASRRIIDPPKTGRIYSGAPFRIGKPPHQASAPGESPAEDTGNLRNSGIARRIGELKAEVRFTADYAPDLEYGNLDDNIMPRPFLRPAVAQGKQNLKRIIETEIKKR